METPFKTTFPVLPAKDLVIFPGFTLPLRAGRPKSVRAVEKAQTEGNWILALSQRPGEGLENPGAKDLYGFGTLCKLEKVRGNSESGFQIVARGVSRFKVQEIREIDGCLVASGEVAGDIADSDGKTSEALVKSLKQIAVEILDLLPADTEQLTKLVQEIDDPVFLTNLCAGNLELPIERKQELLETLSVRDRALKLLDLMQEQKGNLRVQNEIREKLSQRMGKLQRESILREQLKTIREELGEGEDAKAQDSYRERIDKAGMSDEARKIALDELKRLESIGNSSPETHVIRNYLDLLCALPWSKASDQESLDLMAARKILDEDHTGLERIKKRIVQYLAVMKLRKGSKGSILLFVGPPGVGKTSLGQSIARALGRKFVRASLGGVRDDAEIRGHRRTYIGAMPGRLIQGIKRAGESNPVFMLDEIDKLSRSFQGDPASALLEVLDPEQNSNFMDHYLDVPFDLSKVFFIATANTLDTIPGPLLDRMEVIDLSGYTTAEKLHIAKKHLLPKQMSEHGLSPEQAEIADEALLRIITHYTREAGVRELQRKIAAVFRASTEKVLSPGVSLPVRIETQDLEEILGQERFTFEVAERITPPGVVTGLAWTPQGGEILFIEASLMPGSGKMLLTGQLGDVMKESTQLALSLVRSQLASLAPGFDFDKNDLHIHVPAGAIPKDGPSAGTAMLAAIASLFSGRRVNPKTAMTGEITLRGVVMPVGGIKEKILAAHRAGIERVILPKRNERDLKEVPEEVKSQLKFEFVETAQELLRATLGIGPESATLSIRDPAGGAPAVA